MITEAGQPVEAAQRSGEGAASAVIDASNSVRPYPRSWVNVLVDAIDALPAPTIVVYLIIAAFGVLASNAENWIAGVSVFPSLAVLQTYWAVFAVTLLALFPYLDRTALGALETFGPALDGADVDRAGLRYELTVLPAWPALLVTVAAIIVVVMGFASDPAGSGISGLPPAALADHAIGEALAVSLLFLLMYHTLRQLRTVSRIHTLAPNVSLLRPAPLYAFSQLTVRTAIAFVVIVAATFLVEEPGLASYPLLISVPFLAGGIAIAVAAFVLPLRGMHQRLTVEKNALETEVGRRLETAMAAVHRALDADDVSRADGLNKLLASLLAEREMVARLPTWPWRPGTVGALVTAILLPIALFIVTRALERLIAT